MQRLLRCFSELDASLVLSVPRQDLIRAIMSQYDLSEDEAKTVILEKENELKEKVGSEGLNTRVFKRNGTVVYSSSERRASNDSTSSGGGGGGADPRSPQQRMSPPASPHGIFASLSPRSGSPPNMESPLDYFGSPPTPTGGFQRSTGRLSVSSPASTGGGVSAPASGTPCASYSSLSIKKHDLMRGGLGATPTPTTSSLSRSMEDLLIDPISLELMKKPVMLPCGHSFSRRTITKWLQQQNKCPSCNTTATVEDMQPNYALRAVVRQYKKKEAKREAKSSSSTSSTSIITSESGSSIKKLSIPSSGKKSMKKEKKKKSSSSKKSSKKANKKGDHDHRRDYSSGTGSGGGTGEEHLSPFAFFNAWVNGKDKKAKEERQARQRGDDDGQSDDDDDDDDLKSSPEHGGRTETSDANVEAPAMMDDACRQRSATVLSFDPQAAQLTPEQLGGAGGGIVLSGSWYDGFMDTIPAEPGAYQGFLGDSGASNFSASSLASSAATIITSASYFNDGANDGGDGGLIMGDGAMVGGHESVSMGGLIGDDGGDPMGSVGFTSSLFSFDEPSPGKGTSKQENEGEGENEDEEEEGEGEEDEEESESGSSDDDVVDGHAGSWPNKSETIVIDGRGDDDDDSESEQDPATSKQEKAAKMHGLIERFKALSSSREKAGGARGSDSSDNDGSADGDNKRKTDSRDRDALNKAKQAAHEDNTNNSAGNEEEEEVDDDAEEETEDEADDGGDDDDGEADGVSSSSSSSMTSSSSSMTNSGGATSSVSDESEQSEADRRRSAEAKRKPRKKKKATATATTKTQEAEQKKLRRRTTDEESERKLRLALDVEVPHLRYDMQHKGIHVIVSVRAQSAPNASLRASSLVAAVGSPSQEKSGGGGGSLHHHHHHVHNTGSGSDASQALGGERAQIAVIAAIDRSSSMKGPKLSLVKESLLFLTSQLSPGDCMGLVSYDEEVTTEIPLTFLDDAGKDSVLKAVSNIKTGLWTNLSGGLFSALRLLEKLPSNHSNMVCSILLFTDGGANRGLTKTNLIVNALDTELRLLRTKSLAPTVFTFGFGSAPDANMLTKIAEMGNGLYYAIEAAEAIPTAFADCLGGLLSVCAENIRLKLEVSGTGVMINKIYGNQSVAEHSPHKSYSILLGDIYYEETRDVLLALTLPALEQPVDSFLILSATLTYSSLPGGRHTTISSECSVARPTALAIPGDSAPSYEVDKQRNRVHTADAIKQAIAEQEERRFDSAVAILSEAIQQIQQSASASDPFCVNLVENLNECIMRTKRAKASGRDNKISYQSSLALSHSRQRSTHVRGTLTYSTTAKASTTKKFQTVSKSLPVQASPQHSPQKVPRSHSDIKFLLANTKQLFERIRLIYALVEDQCNTKNCPNMTAGPKFEYLWKDEGRYKQATALPAPQYISLLFQTTEQIFTHTPSLPKIRDSLRRLFRVYAHIYHHHVSFFDDIGEMKLLQSSFIAFVRFVREHGLVDDRELLPMHALIQKLKFANA